MKYITIVLLIFLLFLVEPVYTRKKGADSGRKTSVKISKNNRSVKSSKNKSMHMGMMKRFNKAKGTKSAKKKKESSDDTRPPLGAAEQCALDSRELLETNQEINLSFYDTLVWRGIENCSDEGKGEICKIDGGNLPEKMKDFENLCELSGGVPLETEGGSVFGDSLLMCSDDQNKVFGLVPDDYIFCGASSCSELLPSEVIHATLFMVSYDTEDLLGLSCTVEFDDTLDFFELCKDRFQPTGQVCEATENLCAFYTELRPLSCEGFCEQSGGTCVAGYTYNEFSCERDADWDACDDVPGDDWCTCSF